MSIGEKTKNWVSKNLWSANETNSLNVKNKSLLKSLEPTTQRKWLTIFKLNYSILIAETITFKSFNVTIKYALVILLLLITFGFSPAAFPNGVAKFDVDDVCIASEDDNVGSAQVLKSLSNNDAAQQQVNELASSVKKLKLFVDQSYFANNEDSASKIQTHGPNSLPVIRPASELNKVFPDFPNGCNEEQASRALAAATNQKCDQKVCVDDNLLAILCKTIPVPCPSSDLLDKAKEWAKYKSIQDQKVAVENTTVSVSELTTAVDAETGSQLIKTTMNRISFEFNIALSIYNFYKIFGIVFAPPISMLTGTFWTSLTRVAVSMSQSAFVIGFVLIWELYVYLRIPEVQLLLQNFKLNPCFFQSKSIEERLKLVPETCNQINNLKEQFNKYKFEFRNIESEARAYGSCFGEHWKSHKITSEIPAEFDFDASIFLPLANNLSFDSVTFADIKKMTDVPFSGKCDPKLFLNGVSSPTKEANFPIPSGPILAFIAKAFMPTILFHLVLYFVAVIHPQVLYSGKYEALPGNLVSFENTYILESIIVKHLRRMQILPLLIWTLSFVLVIILILTQ